MSAVATNPYERVARAEKVAKLVRAIDLTSRSIGMDPIRSALEVARRLRAQSLSFWTDLAKFAGCNVPSEFTQREIVGVYLARASEARKRAE